MTLHGAKSTGPYGLRQNDGPLDERRDDRVAQLAAVQIASQAT